ncbi:HsmA family protein [Enterococcus phoeniculicola]|uniref:TIGR03987 family protein n=1 Tax=Enterococcus phoeniculicola ATCC BAA-412 TaxID=1158610 RepID=R3W2R1_9ENTE|nr:HsmA family protein [Enterococcus phoeniculicola]EOL41746.1 TIGR03987 family protein [Enterococcus phoeniculicola ATCC BAA-412]EOT78760.1 TIGR03987 family protein [Enterococcus phoeniculicola ATCC BAA-412]
MSMLLIIAIICMTLALGFYTIGVFAEKKSGTLLTWHAIVFWCGFIFDTTGTSIMSKLAGSGFQLNLHGVTGLIALLLMAFHAIWATVLLIRKDDQSKKVFHKFSIVVWAIWLIPYVMGMFIGMNG